jgi:RNA polymerase sigma factor (sigma-70 family)
VFRDGNEEAFRVIHDRYRTRLFAYTRQMLPGSRHDAEDALQDIFVRAYSGLRANDRELSLKAWLYRVAHNRCVDELRKPPPPAPEVLGILRPPSHDPTAEAEQRESLRRLIADVRRLPDQQRSALLMRELGGMPYADLAAALSVSVPAVKSLLVRARVSLAQALEARDTACAEIREELIVAHDRGVRASGLARRHMHDCAGCREFRGQIRGVSRQFAALAPPAGVLGVLANIFGIGGGAGAGGGAAAASTGAAAASGVAGTTGAVASVGALAGVGHVATILAAAVVTAGGAVELQHSLVTGSHHAKHHAHIAAAGDSAPAAAITSSPVVASAPATAPTVAPAMAVPPVHRKVPGAKQPGSSTSSTGKTATSTPTSTGGSGTSPGSGLTQITPTVPATTATGTTGTTATSTAGGSSTATGTTDPNTISAPTDPTAAGSTTGTAPSTGSVSTSTATGDLISLGVATSSTPPATGTSATSSSSTPATTSPVASYPSGGTSWSGGRHH